MQARFFRLRRFSVGIFSIRCFIGLVISLASRSLT